MNLYELNELIQILIDEDIPENNALIKFYLKKRKELVAEIMNNIKNNIDNALKGFIYNER